MQMMQMRLRVNRLLAQIDDIGHGLLPALWARTWIGVFVCDQTEFYITGDEEFRRF